MPGAHNTRIKATIRNGRYRKPNRLHTRGGLSSSYNAGSRRLFLYSWRKTAFLISRNGPFGFMRFLTVVLDSGGVGALPDFSEYGDASGANTLGNVARQVGGLKLPSFERLGLGHLTAMPGVLAIEHPSARVARLRERSRGKDTIPAIGRWRGSSPSSRFRPIRTAFPPRSSRRSPGSPAGAARQCAGLRHRDHRKARARSIGDGAADPLYFGGFGLSGGGARGGDPSCDPVRLVRAGSRHAA